MSGEKRRYVSVEDQELRRLREQESRLRTLQQDLPERLNRVREEAKQEFQQRLAPLEARTKKQEQESKQLRSTLASLEQNTQQRLKQQREEFQNALNSSQQRQQQSLVQETQRLESAMKAGFEEQRSEYLRITSQQRQEYLQLNEQLDVKFSHLITQERQAREAEQKALQQQIDQVFANIEEEKQDKTSLATNLLADVEQIWHSINQNYQHHRFAPGKLADLQRNLELAHNNFANGLNEAAIATSQEAYLQLADLRIELEQKEQEWQLLYSAALEDLYALVTEVQANRQIQLDFGEGDEIEHFHVEVDYWTQGTLTNYEQQILALQKQLQEGENTLTSDRLKEIGDEITQLIPQLSQIVDQAAKEILGSQMRAEIADKVVGVLQGMGYQLLNPEADSIYEGSDQRQSYIVKVKNIAGDEVVTVIAPEREFGTNSVSVNTFSQTTRDENLTQQQAKAIFEVLEAEGINSQGQTICNDSPQQQYRDLTQVAQPKNNQQSVNNNTQSTRL